MLVISTRQRLASLWVRCGGRRKYMRHQ